jgi:catechol 2,3-dioxygenase-like lactoylglutathione lyase family enzyme
MIEHISLRCRNASSSRKFYQQALAPLGYKMDRNYGDAFGFIQGGRHDFWISDGKVGTPNHVAFHADDEKRVDAFTEQQSPPAGRTTVLPGHAMSTATRHLCSILTGTTSRPWSGMRN